MKQLYLICFLFLYSTVSAQDLESGIEARLSVIQDPGDQRPLMAIGISFINHTDKDIYLPGIHNMSKEQSEVLISIYKKKERGYIPTPLSRRLTTKDETPGMLENHITMASVLTSDLNMAKKTIDDERISEIKKIIQDKGIKVDAALFAYDNAPLFLKAGEERTYFYTVEIQSLAYPGQYKLAYEPKLVENEGVAFPDELVGYKKCIPAKIVSNPVYIDFVEIKNRIPRKSIYQ